MASFANRFEALAGMLHAAGGFEPLEAAYLRQWLHSDQARDAGGGGRREAEVDRRGSRRRDICSPMDAAGASELHPDGNSLDFFKGLVRKKMQS